MFCDTALGMECSLEISTALGLKGNAWTSLNVMTTRHHS